MDALVLSRAPQQCLGLCAGGALAFVQLRGAELFQRVWPSIHGRRPGVWLAAAAHTGLALYAGSLMWRAWRIRRQRHQQIYRLFERSWTIASKVRRTYIQHNSSGSNPTPCMSSSTAACLASSCHTQTSNSPPPILLYGAGSGGSRGAGP
jgi:hypothetical protein